jgi:exosome complex exonuclease RRP6
MYCDFTPDKRYQLADWRIRCVVFHQTLRRLASSFFVCRPLPEEMLSYARSDTHFLLYIYDNLRNALLDRSLSRPPSPLSTAPSMNSASHYINRVLSLSANTALRLYSKEVYDEQGGGSLGWDSMAKKWNKGSLTRDASGSVGKEVFKAVHRWRDKVGREDDESVRYVSFSRKMNGGTVLNCEDQQIRAPQPPSISPRRKTSK